MDKPKKNRTSEQMAFLTNFYSDYKALECIVRKHWPILLRDKTLVNLIPKRSQFIYRRAPNLRNKLAPNIHDSPKKKITFLDQTGFFYCRRCKACKTTRKNIRKIDQFKFFRTGREYSIKKLITCKSTHITYVVACPCGLQYIGWTTRFLSIRINEHFNNIKKGFPKHSLSNHFRMYHNRDPSLATFFGIDRVEPHWREGNMTQGISKNETEWIFRLNRLNPARINVDIDLNFFLSNY